MSTEVKMPSVDGYSPQLQHTPGSAGSQPWTQFLDGNFESATFADLDALVSGGQYFGSVGWNEI